MVHRRGVAGGGQHEVEGIGIAGHDHAVEGGGREVADPGLEPPLLALGDDQGGLRDRHVDLGFCERRLLREQLCLCLQMVALAASRAAMLAFH